MISNDLTIYFQNKFIAAYTSITITNLLLLIILHVKIKRGYVNIPHAKFLCRTIVFTFMLNIMDCIWEYATYGGMKPTPQIGMLINTVYFIVLHFAYFYLFIYFFSNVVNNALPAKKISFMMVPTLIIILLNLLNLKYHFLFSITPDGRYVREQFCMLEYVLPYLYIPIPWIKNLKLIKKSKEEGIPYKKINRNTITAPITIGIMGTVGMFIDTAPLISVAITYVITFIYLDSVEDYITVDPISALPNNIEFIEELKYRIDIENLKHRDNLYIIVIDILGLRKINEKYGYNEGDRVIRRVSDSLRRKTSLGDKLNLYACRYSGPQYFLVVNTDDSNDIMTYCANLQTRVNNSNAINLVDYNVELMFGFCKYKDKYKVMDFIELALGNLEANKHKYKELKKNIFNNVRNTNIKET